MTKSEKQWWEHERAVGYNRFLLRSLLWPGLPFGITMTLGAILVPVFTHRPVDSFRILAIQFGFYTVAFGGGMGMITWRRREQDYAKSTEDDHAA